jgi:antitoxin component YwqK of YwqJK toxin-antitoxin module
MYCPKCGAQTPDDAVFCGKCGFKIQSVSSTNTISQDGMNKSSSGKTISTEKGKKISTQTKPKNYAKIAWILVAATFIFIIIAMILVPSKSEVKTNPQGDKDNQTGKEEKIPENGVFKLYHKNGKLSLEANYKDSKLEGIWKQYYDNGKLWDESNFKDDKQEGISKLYYESGKLMLEANYKNGKQEGISKAYYESGKFAGEANYKNGKKDGISKEYYENGNIKSIEINEAGKLINIKRYKESGELESEEDFSKDR